MTPRSGKVREEVDLCKCRETAAEALCQFTDETLKTKDWTVVRLRRGAGWLMRTRKLALFLLGNEEERATFSAWGRSKKNK